MTPEQKQQILDNAPQGATHWFNGVYLKQTTGSDDFFSSLKNGVIPLDSLREPQENWSEEDERRMDVIGSNGNGAYHYSELEKQKRSKYHREIKPGVWVDVYDVIVAWAVSNPALQHLLKKALQPGERGHKTIEKDMQDIIDSAVRAQQIEVERVK